MTPGPEVIFDPGALCHTAVRRPRQPLAERSKRANVVVTASQHIHYLTSTGLGWMCAKEQAFMKCYSRLCDNEDSVDVIKQPRLVVSKKKVSVEFDAKYEFKDKYKFK